MHPIPLVICERTGDWAEAFRRAAESFGGHATLRTIETRSSAECRRRLSERRSTSAGLPLLIELSIGGGSEVCELLAWHARRFGNAPRMVVASRGFVDYEVVMREAGATLFVASSRDLRSCVAEYLRFRDDPAHVPLEDERTIPARLRDSLPWEPRNEAV